MTKVALPCMVVFMALTFGCVQAVSVDRANLLPTGGQSTVGTGDVFFEREVMTGQKNVGDPSNSVFGGEAYRFDLVVEGISKGILKLGYSEYMKSPSRYGYYQNSPWMKKPAFSRTLEFDLNESKIVAFQSYEFEILNVEGGRMTYRRIR